MLGSAPGNSGSDKTFLMIQVIGLLAWVFVLLVARHIPSWSLWPLSVVAFIIVLVVPAYWYFVYPPIRGLDSAGRILFGIPLVVGNLVLSIIAIHRIARLTGAN
jgi:hypothetical protein